MGIFDKVKDYINNTGEDQIDTDMDVDEIYSDPEEDNASPEPIKSYSDISSSSRAQNVIDLKSTGRTPVVLKKIDVYQDVQGVADVLNERKIVILNLETCPNDISQRVIDFLSGVAYANSGDIKKIAGRAYIITPDSVPLSGDQLEEIESSGLGYFE